MSAAELGFTDPSATDGSWLATWPDYDLTEPLNMVISNKSDPYILEESTFLDWSLSIGFALECGGSRFEDIIQGARMNASLGDGKGTWEQQGILRWMYDSPIYGTCLESLQGGNHYRYWQQAGSGAFFLGVSAEENLAHAHAVIDDGYDLGRDYVVGNATVIGGTTSALTGIVYTAVATYVSGFLRPGSELINHGVALDGQVAVLTISIVDDSATKFSPWSLLVAGVFLLWSALGALLAFFWFRPSHVYSRIPLDDSDPVHKHKVSCN